MRKKLFQNLAAMVLAITLALLLVPSSAAVAADSTLPAPYFGLQLKQYDNGGYYAEIVFDKYTSATASYLYYEYRSKPSGASDSEYTDWVEGGYAYNTANTSDRTRRLPMEFDTDYQVRGYVTDQKGGAPLSGYTRLPISSYPEYAVAFFVVYAPEPGEEYVEFDFEFEDQQPESYQVEYRKNKGAWIGLEKDAFRHLVTDAGTYEYRMRAVTSGKFYGPWTYSEEVVVEFYTGWLFEEFSQKWQYFEAGDKLTGWLFENGRWYYLSDDYYGYMQTGWQFIDGKWYHFESWGAMQTGWQLIDGKWYYFAPGGAMQTGWQKINGCWYYFASGGVMQTGWQTINSKTYYFHSGGAMAASEYVNGWWLGPDGSWTYPYQATWRQGSKGWWYGDESGWYAKNATYKIDGKSYTFDANGWLK